MVTSLFRPRYFICLLTAVLLTTCIDPYTPKLTEYKPMLVVEGIITNENISYKIKLSRTVSGLKSKLIVVPDATVSITDESGKVTKFINNHNGIYSSDSTLFTGKVGKSYTLNIHTRDGNEYKSDSCKMFPIAGIDSIFFEKNIGFIGNENEPHYGISIYVDSKPDITSNGYFRWEYEEVWKTNLSNPKMYDYRSESEIVPVKDFKRYCWKKANSSEVLINSFVPGINNHVERQPVCFIASDATDRLCNQYSILIRQLSLSYKEYDFWRKLKKVSESGGDIFISQPFPVESNIHNINDPDETVIGYFEISAVAQKRRYITFSETIVNLNLRPYPYWNECSRIEVSPSDYPYGVNTYPTFDELYRMFTQRNAYTFIEPIYRTNGSLYKLVFSPVPCSICETSKTITKPDYWVDIF